MIEKGITPLSIGPVDLMDDWPYEEPPPESDVLLLRTYETIEQKIATDNRYYAINSICLPRQPRAQDTHPNIQAFLTNGGYPMLEKHGRDDFTFAGYGYHLFGPPRLTGPGEQLLWSDYQDMRQLVYLPTNVEDGKLDDDEDLARKLRTVKMVMLDPYMHSLEGKELLYFINEEFTALGKSIQDNFWKEGSSSEKESHMALLSLKWTPQSHHVRGIIIQHLTAVRPGNQIFPTKF